MHVIWISKIYEGVLAVEQVFDSLIKTSKNEGIFCEIVFVGVRWYGRERFREKQEMTGILDESPSLKF